MLNFENKKSWNSNLSVLKMNQPGNLKIQIFIFCCFAVVWNIL